jgi:hypothetical protein
MFDTVFVIIFIDKKEIAHKALWDYLLYLSPTYHHLFYRAGERIAKNLLESITHTEIIEHKPEVVLLAGYLVTRYQVLRVFVTDYFEIH